MDFIPPFRLIVAIFLFGLLFYVFDPVITYLNELYPTSGVYAEAMFLIWGALALINLFGSSIKFIMFMQKQEV